MTDAKVIVMIPDLSDSALHDILSTQGVAVIGAPREVLESCVRTMYESGRVSGDEIVAAWEADSDDS